MSKKFLQTTKAPFFIGAFLLLTLFLIVSLISLRHGGRSLEISSALASNENWKNGEINLEEALEPRAIGSKDADLVIHEYSSLSCGHCAKYHNETLDKLKSEYVDTGKVQIVFHEFPLNRPALFASMIARCLPKSDYYNFIQLLFKTQQSWAYTNKFEERLRQNAKLAGLSEERIDKCLDNKLLQEALIEKIELAQENYAISSTPTFIFNKGPDRITGAQPFSAFEKKINKYLD